jgi:hypothetical protein
MIYNKQISDIFIHQSNYKLLFWDEKGRAINSYASRWAASELPTGCKKRTDKNQMIDRIC